MTRLIPYLLPLLLIGLTLLASSPHSQSQSGVLLLSPTALERLALHVQGAHPQPRRPGFRPFCISA